MAVKEFNDSQSGCVVQLVDYSNYNTFNEQTGKDRLNTDIISGKTPDIYDLGYWSENQLAEKGLLENLKPYFDSDADFPYSLVLLPLPWISLWHKMNLLLPSCANW